MDFLRHSFTHATLSIFMYWMLLFFLPPYILYTILCFIKRSRFSENVAGKVVLITGASSGIGQHLAYEYAQRGARLALVARREGLLREVAEKARELGSEDVIFVCADVSKIDDCKRFIEETLTHFGTLDHLVNNAGILQTKSFADYTEEFSDLAPIMDVNFWGSVYPTKFAIPHLTKSRGKIVVIASAAAYIPTPKMSFYDASKAALVSFFETLRMELAPNIGITIVTPGMIKSEMIQDAFITEVMKVNSVQAMPAELCAKSIVDSACRGDKHLTEPSWVKLSIQLKTFFPELFEWAQRFACIKRLEDSKKDG